jgi:hypothetical protein
MYNDRMAIPASSLMWRPSCVPASDPEGADEENAELSVRNPLMTAITHFQDLDPFCGQTRDRNCRDQKGLLSTIGLAGSSGPSQVTRKESVSGLLFSHTSLPCSVSSIEDVIEGPSE